MYAKSHHNVLKLLIKEVFEMIWSKMKVLMVLVFVGGGIFFATHLSMISQYGKHSLHVINSLTVHTHTYDKQSGTDAKEELEQEDVVRTIRPTKEIRTTEFPVKELKESFRKHNSDSEIQRFVKPDSGIEHTVKSTDPIISLEGGETEDVKTIKSKDNRKLKNSKNMKTKKVIKDVIEDVKKDVKKDDVYIKEISTSSTKVDEEEEDVNLPACSKRGKLLGKFKNIYLSFL